MFNRHFVDNVSKQIVLVCATVSLLILFLIVIFIFKEGFPAFAKIGLLNFLFGTEWSLKEEKFSILPLIIGSVLAMLGTVIIATPLSIACAVFLAEVAPRRINSILRQAIEVLAGIPSVVYGLVGMLMLVPLVGQLGGSGYSLLAGIVVLTIMVLPTMVTITVDSLRAVPVSYKEAALALGSTQWQAIWMVLLPAARSGITAAFILGMARAIGETMAVYMVIGNAFALPRSILDPSRTLTSHIVGQILESASGSLHLSALFAVGIVLIIFILVFNSVAYLVRRKTL